MLCTIMCFTQLNAELKGHDPYDQSGEWWKELKKKVADNVTINKVCVVNQYVIVHPHTLLDNLLYSNRCV